MGIKTPACMQVVSQELTSEKPPHHMGIKTSLMSLNANSPFSLKNLPTTWGLRRNEIISIVSFSFSSEKPPHHMGIKTAVLIVVSSHYFSEKPPHHMGIKTMVSPFLD